MTITAGDLSISEVATLLGISAHTLRYYERAELMLNPIDRASSRHRRSTENDISWVRFLTRLRSTAMPISRIWQHVELARAGDDTSAARLELLSEHRKAVVAHLNDLNTSLAAIDYKIALYEEQVAQQ